MIRLESPVLRLDAGVQQLMASILRMPLSRGAWFWVKALLTQTVVLRYIIAG